ncbi:MAG: Fic family protein [Acidimicrobiales bacterium]
MVTSLGLRSISATDGWLMCIFRARVTSRQLPGLSYLGQACVVAVVPVLLAGLGGGDGSAQCRPILAGVRGRERQPGDVRTTQNWIGPPGATIQTATFVPPPPDQLGDLLDDLEHFVHEDPLLPPLLQAALVHYQFETIHPFLDGNGRLGRLLIVFFLVVRERLPEPLLYLSPYFEAHRSDYYDALQRVREHGDLDHWLALFLDGVRVQAADAVTRAERLIDLREQYRPRVRAVTRGAANALVDLAFEQPILNARLVERRLGVTRPAALAALRQLAKLDILTETSGGPRGQLRWRAQQVLAALLED